MCLMIRHPIENKTVTWQFILRYTHIKYFALQYFSFMESLSFVVKSVILLKKPGVIQK